MNEQEKRAYLENYEREKKKGVPFFPDILFKDAAVSLLIFIALVGLAYFIGAPLEARANPADSSYTPRPEWYFLFLFQLLKYFPGSLEVIGVIVIPALVILILFALPYLDRSAKRHYTSRLPIVGATVLVFFGVIALSIQAYRETPPPTESAKGDPIAARYTENCAPCHGPGISVQTGTNLHEIIAQGKHEGMPAWNGDLSSDEIDALVGFILSPVGDQLFRAQCAACHDVEELVASDPIQLKDALEEGPNFSEHAGVDVPTWTDLLSPEERISLLNFLIAPDGLRLFDTNCAACHGRAIAFSGSETELESIIRQGGQHLEMPPWRETLSEAELETLAAYVVDPGSNPGGSALFEAHCSTCHGERIPAADNVETAYETIAGGGAHEIMPVWGDILTPEQIDALVEYTYSTAVGPPLELGQQLFDQNCASCHGDFGEGGPNPTRQGDVIAPISSAEYLNTRDDATLRAVIAQGQPNFGMAPFGIANGGPLDDEDIDAIVAFIRSWESNPPVEVPPEVAVSELPLSSAELYQSVCAQCHGTKGEGLIGPSLRDPKFQAANSDQEIFDTINLGHPATPMIAWGEVLTSSQIQQLIQYIRGFEEGAPSEAGVGGESPSFANDVMPILNEHCAACHGTFGGWDASSYDSVMTTGDNAPVVIPEDIENSLLAQKISGTQSEGAKMPPTGLMMDEEIQIILDWIEAGALDN